MNSLQYLDVAAPVVAEETGCTVDNFAIHLRMQVIDELRGSDYANYIAMAVADGAVGLLRLLAN